MIEINDLKGFYQLV